MTHLEKLSYPAKAHPVGGRGGGAFRGDLRLPVVEREGAREPVDAAEQPRDTR